MTKLNKQGEGTHYLLQCHSTSPLEYTGTPLASVGTPLDSSIFTSSRALYWRVACHPSSTDTSATLLWYTDDYAAP